jgi:hypothetical protein
VVKYLKTFPLLLLLISCSIKQREEQAQIRNLYKKGLYGKALSVLEKSSIKKEEENRLLYLLNKGKLLYANKDYYEASQVLLNAQEKMDKLYTKKVRELLLSGVINDNSDSYRGQIYERSLLFYYQALAYLKIYQNGKYHRLVQKINKEKKKETVKEVQVLTPSQKRQELFKARAAIVSWDTFYKELQRSDKKSNFTHDLFAKILGAEIHELINKRSDGQIALQLYKDALKILERLGPTFKVFNEFSENYHQELWENNKISKKHIKLNDNYKRTESFILENILRLTKKYRSYEYTKLKRVYLKRNPDIDLDLKKNVRVLIETDLIAEMIAKDFSYNLRSAIEEVESPTAKAFIRGVGVPILTYFAMGPLGLGSVSRTGNTYIYMRHNVGEKIVEEAGIEFEMPVVNYKEAQQGYKLLVFKEKKDVQAKDEKKEKKKVSYNLKDALIQEPLNIVGPISDMANMMNKETLSNSFSSRGARIAIKHVIAIIAAYKTYKAMQDSSGELLARPAAFAQYVASAKGIKASEKADTRQWVTLPSNIYLNELSLAKGHYVLMLQSSKPQSPMIKLGKIEVESSKSQELFSFINK